MPAIRYSRDKRGYETTAVVHTYRGNGGPGTTRVLYLFRTPPHISVGRRPLDDESREALEHTHPDLSFDWQGLGRDMAMARDAAGRAWRERDPRAARQEPPRAKPRPVDQSVLGRALGAEAASRLRARYAELRQRIERRARTPEERQELIARLERLNPDDWPDEATAVVLAQSVEADWEAVRTALPQRRRGRRRREPGADAKDAGASAIISDGGDLDDAFEDRQVDGADRAADVPGDGDPLGAAGGDGLPIDD